MGDVGVAFGQSNTDPAQGPVINLPSMTAPTHIVITPRMQQDKDILDVFDPQEQPEAPKGDFWDSLPNAEGTQTQAKGDAALPNEQNFWDTLPDAQVAKISTAPSYTEDLLKTVVGSTIPRGLAGAAMAAPNLGNLPTQIAAWGINKYGKNPLTGEPLTDEQRQNLNNARPFYSSEDALQGAAQATGLPPPYDPTYPTNKYLDTIGQFAIGGKSLGALSGAAQSIPKLAAIGAATQGISDRYPNNPIAPLVAAVASERGLTGMGKGINYASNKLGIGPKTAIGGVNATDYQKQQAANNVYNSASNPQQVIADTGQQPVTSMGPMPQQPNATSTILGSNPTLAEATNDQGIAQYQDALRTKNPEVFQGNTALQNEARANALNAVKGEGSPDNLGVHLTQQMQNDEALSSAQENKTLAGVTSKGAKIGKYGEIPKEGVTNDTIQNAQSVRNESERSAWSFMDSYGKSPADMQTAREAAKGAALEAQEYGAVPLHPAEDSLIRDLTNPPKGAKDNFESLKRFITRVGEAQREVPPRSVPMKRLQEIKNSLYKGLENTINGIVAHEQQAVESGRMSEENGIEAQANQWLAEKYAGERQLRRTADGGVYLAKDAGSRPSSVSGGHGTRGETGGKSNLPNEAKGNTKTAEPLAFGKEQKAQYESARGNTFKNKTLSDLENSGAVNPDGTLDAKKYDRWYAKNKDRFKTYPKFREELNDWRSAQESLNNMRAERVSQENEFNKSRFSSLVKNDPVTEVGRIFRSGNPPAEFRALVEKVRNDQPAMEGLKAAVGEHLLKVARADIAEEGSSLRSPQAFRDFIRNHNKSLKIIYGGQGLNNIEAIGADIRRTQQWNERAKIKGQSNTAKDMGQVAKNDRTSILSKIMAHAEIAGAVVSKMAGHGAGEGFLAGIPLKMVNAFHSSGLDTIEKVELEMIRNPAFANVMLRKVGAKDIPVPIQKRIATVLLSTVPPAISSQQETKTKKE